MTENNGKTYPNAFLNELDQDKYDIVGDSRLLEQRVFEKVDLMIATLDSGKGYDKRWMSIFKTHIEEGFMALRRSITQPNGRWKNEAQKSTEQERAPTT